MERVDIAQRIFFFFLESREPESYYGMSIVDDNS
jgi:hypothetical protein